MYSVKGRKKKSHDLSRAEMYLRAARRDIKQINTWELRGSSFCCGYGALAQHPEGQKANGYLNSCGSQALKHVIPADNLPAERPAAHRFHVMSQSRSSPFISFILHGSTRSTVKKFKKTKSHHFSCYSLRRQSWNRLHVFNFPVQ